MQMLVYVHNHDGRFGQGRVGGVKRGEAPPEASQDPQPPSSFARVWVDELAKDPAAEVRRIVAERFEWGSPEAGEKVQHYTEHASLELMVEPGFDEPAQVMDALLACLAQGLPLAS